MKINWMRCEGDQWCNFIKLNIYHPHFENLDGVFIIWHGGPNPWTVYVGQGNVRNQIATKRLDQSILQYIGLGVYVTWAKVESNQLNGIQKFLIEKWKPKIVDRIINTPSIEVNSPWK